MVSPAPRTIFLVRPHPRPQGHAALPRLTSHQDQLAGSPTILSIVRFGEYYGVNRYLLLHDKREPLKSYAGQYQEIWGLGLRNWHSPSLPVAWGVFFGNPPPLFPQTLAMPFFRKNIIKGEEKKEENVKQKLRRVYNKRKVEST
jgi:hypothetical protein